jgi:hypothetical protein
MEDIRGMLDRLPELSEAELSDLEEKIIQSFGTVEAQEISRESVAEMTFLADSVETVRAELAKREAEKAELAAQASEAATRITAEAPEASVEEVSEAAAPETFSSDEPVVEAEPAAELAAEAVEGSELSSKKDEEELEDELPPVEDELGAPMTDVPPVEDSEAVDASEDEEDEKKHSPVFAASEDVPNQSAEAHMGTEAVEPVFSAPADRQPVVRVTRESAPVSLVAGGDIPGVTAGSPIDGRMGLAEAMATRLHSLRRASGGTGEQVVVASLQAQFPEDRTLRGNETDSNAEKLKKVVSPTAVVASGGWCAPLPVNYDIFNIGGSTAKPLRDSLPVFNADRGGVRYIVPPEIADYVGAIGTWTNADDEAAKPPNSTNKKKACLTVKCAEEESVYLDAVTMCLCFGNLQTRAFPELIARHNELALVQAARYEELYILGQIKTASTAVTVDAVLGAARDTLISVERAAVAYRNQFRLDPDLPLRFVAPQWLFSMIRSDLTAQLPGDGMETTFSLANSEIDGFFTDRNIRPVWTLEGLGTQPTTTDYPDTVEWGLFAEGTFTLLDGGTLDIGIVRDMDLVSTNDYCMFTEQFLGVAKTGNEAFWATQAIKVNGGSAGTLDVAAVDY